MSSPEPIYNQIIQQIKNMLDRGDLKGGDSLPPIRTLASQLDVAVNTVARAYREMEAEGIIVSNGRRGSFIRKDCNSSDCNEIFTKEIRSLIKAGLNKKQILQIFKDELEKQVL